MRRHHFAVLLAVFAIIGLALATVLPAEAQDRTLDWRRWDVDVQINEDGTFDVRETYEIEFIGGPFTFGYREIPFSQFENLTDVRVVEEGVVYEQNFSGNANTFHVVEDDGNFVITWYFPPATNEARTFTVEYKIHGGIIISEEVGDRFFWKAIGPDHAYPIGSSTVVVRMPPGATIDTSIEPATFGPDATYEISDDLTTVTYYAENIRANQEFEVGVRFPHGFIPSEKPAWQAAYEREQTWNDTVRPVLNLGLGVASILLLGGGLFGVYMLWVTRGRDPKVGPVPEYLSEPPSDLRPGVVGTLLDEQADMQDIIATLVDLARRDVIHMQEIEEVGFLGLTTSKNFVFHRIPENEQDLQPYEKTLIKKMFGSREQVELEDLQNKFYTAIPTLQNQLYKAAVKEGLFPENPKSVRSRWSSLGIGGLVLAVGGACLAGAALADMVDAVLCPFVSLGVVSVAMLIAGRAMPVKTQKGAEEAAKWRAFKTYLEHAEQYTDLQEVTDQFDRYLPYAIALGLERTWLNKFSRVPGTPIPRWYYPVGMPYGPRGYYGTSGTSSGTTRGRVGAPAGSAGPRDVRGDAVRPAPSLDSMSQNLAGSLSSMSAGLATMLNSTANTFRSQPSSSGGSGGGFSGGGFSGGGFSGGGGGGGGGAGFG